MCVNPKQGGVRSHCSASVVVRDFASVGLPRYFNQGQKADGVTLRVSHCLRNARGSLERIRGTEFVAQTVSTCRDRAVPAAERVTCRGTLSRGRITELARSEDHCTGREKCH